jgi:ubiquinol-cytochrome c reductase cytochrome c subunit
MRRRQRLLAGLTVLGLAVLFFVSLRPLGAAVLAQTPSPVPTSPTSPGRDLYLRDCAWCHGSQGEGTGYGPTLIGVGAASADFMLSTGRMPISRPDVQPQRSEVPYTKAEIAALVQFVSSFGTGPAIPPVNISKGSLAAGAELYQENCAACHGATGAGGALTNGLTAPTLDRSTPVQVAEAIRIGGAGLRSGNMPQFGPDTLTDQQVDDIARYVEYIRHPNDRGGENLGHLGPIPEGFVAWAIGLLSLILVIRWIGTSE